MAGDAYLPADGEIEAEHAWVNEWAGLSAASTVVSHAVLAPVNKPAAVSPPARVVPLPAMIEPAAMPAAPSGDEIPASTADAVPDQLLRDIVEIEFTRDMLEREPVSVPAPRRRIRMPVVVGGVLGLILVTAASVAAGLIKVQR